MRVGFKVLIAVEEAQRWRAEDLMCAAATYHSRATYHVRRHHIRSGKALDDPNDRFPGLRGY
jgi:hypothetical protein